MKISPKRYWRCVEFIIYAKELNSLMFAKSNKENVTSNEVCAGMWGMRSTLFEVLKLSHPWGISQSRCIRINLKNTVTPLK